VCPSGRPGKASDRLCARSDGREKRVMCTFFLRRTCCLILITLPSLNSGVVLFHKLCIKAPENQSSPRVRVRRVYKRLRLHPLMERWFPDSGKYTNGSGCILRWSVGFQIRERTFILSYQISMRCQIILQICRRVGSYIH